MISKDYTTGGMTGHLQLASLDRHAMVKVDGTELEAFTVKAGDVWNPDKANGDASKHSERTEFRSETEDTVGDGKLYVYTIPILIPLDYPEFSPKQTFAQWHEGDYPVASVRYENGKLEFITNYKSGFDTRIEIPHTKGKLVEIVAAFVWNPGEKVAFVTVIADDRLVRDLPHHTLVENGTKTIYFKYGIYRSGMNAYKGPKPAPDQTVMFGNVRRNIDGEIYRPAAPVVTAPIAVTPAPVIPTPAAPAASLYARIAALKVSIQSLEPDMSPKYVASVGFLAQAVEKLEKMQAQMEKVDAKAK